MHVCVRTCTCVVSYMCACLTFSTVECILTQKSFDTKVIIVLYFVFILWLQTHNLVVKYFWIMKICKFKMSKCPHITDEVTNYVGSLCNLEITQVYTKNHSVMISYQYNFMDV